MAVGPSDISGNDWCGPVNSSPAADRMSDENFGAKPNLDAGVRPLPKITHLMPM